MQSKPDSNDTRQYLKAKAIAARFGLCPRTIFRLADAGKIQRHKVSARAVMFDVGEVEAFFAASRVGPPVNANATRPPAA